MASVVADPMPPAVEAPPIVAPATPPLPVVVGTLLPVADALPVVPTLAVEVATVVVVEPPVGAAEAVPTSPTPPGSALEVSSLQPAATRQPNPTTCQRGRCREVTATNAARRRNDHETCKATRSPGVWTRSAPLLDFAMISSTKARPGNAERVDFARLSAGANETARGFRGRRIHTGRAPRAGDPLPRGVTIA